MKPGHLFNTDLPSLQGRPHLQLSASDLGLLGVLVCDMEAPQIMTADPCVLKNLLRCPRLTVMQTAALNALLASGKTQIGWVVPGIRVSGDQGSWMGSFLEMSGSLRFEARIAAMTSYSLVIWILTQGPAQLWHCRLRHGGTGLTVHSTNPQDCRHWPGIKSL